MPTIVAPESRKKGRKGSPADSRASLLADPLILDSFYTFILCPVFPSGNVLQNYRMFRILTLLQSADLIQICQVLDWKGGSSSSVPA
jgi:hypothetical protein